VFHVCSNLICIIVILNYIDPPCQLQCTALNWPPMKISEHGSVIFCIS
jgi:hypothetical protein